MQLSILRKNFLKRIIIARHPKGKTFLLYALTVDKGTNFIYNYDMIETKVTRKKRVDRRHIVYQITNLINGNFYIGITAGFKEKDLKVRFQKHVRRALTEGKSWTLCKEIRKFGQDYFEYKILQVVRGKEVAHLIERDLIAVASPALNTK